MNAADSLADFLGVPEARLRFARPPEVTVSIVVLTYNRAEHTYRCLDAILWHADVPYELIIVDNASRDETDRLLARLDNATILRNPENVGFGEGCNQGAAVARGRYLLLLNNDAQLTAGCLRTLVETAERQPDCAAVGCKIVTPDGRLQEAGSIIWDDGTTLGYGRHDAPEALQYSYVREVDYCSAACLLVRADVWKRTGGFDARYAPAYYEDADLAMAMGALGLRVVYQPAAVIVHQEYTSSSPDAARDLMVRNRERFVEKWARELEAQPSASDRNVLRARNRARHPTLLFIDDRVESPDFGSGIRRMWTMLTMLAEMRYRVTCVPLLDPTPRDPWVTKLQQMGIEVVTGSLVFEEFARERAGLYDVVIISRPNNMQAAHGVVRRHFPEATLIYDAEALYFVREELRVAALGSASAGVVCEEQRALEAALLRGADFAITVSEYEQHMVLHLVPELAGRTFVWGHCMTGQPTAGAFETRADLLFVGSFPIEDSPNEHAVLWFLDHVFPAVAQELGCTFRVVGRAPESLRRRASTSVEFAGFVPDLGPEYDRHRVFVVPHQFSAGIAYKLDEAMSRGIPAVVSELTARQLDLVDGETVLVGRTPEEFVDKIVQLYRDPELWARLRHSALHHVAERCNPSRVKAALKDALTRAMPSGNRRRQGARARPMRRVLILHVGPHKTGTTYLQQRLVADRDLLLERARVVYPRTGQDILFGHHSLARLFRDGADHAPAIRPLREELAAGDVGLLSSERFSRLDRAQFARIRDHFQEFDVRPVVYLRVRSELLVSRWGEAVKHGMVRSFPEFLNRALGAPDQDPIINQRLLLDLLADVFGMERLDVLIYRPDTDLYVEFVRTILGTDAVIADSRGSHAVVNPSLPAHVTECLRCLHIMARARGRLDRRLVTERAMSYLGDPAHHAELERVRRLFDENAGVVDLAHIDQMFRHLDEELMTAYADQVRNAGADGRFPASKVTSVRCFRDLGDGGSGELEAVVSQIYGQVFRDG